MKTPDFKAALESIHRDIPRVHHGRTVAGIDCVGLVLIAYARAGLPVWDLDIPYSVKDAYRAHRVGQASRQLAESFNDVTESALLKRKLQDGDVVLMSAPGHMGISCGQFLWQMTDRLTQSDLSRALPFATSAWRHKSLGC